MKQIDKEHKNPHPAFAGKGRDVQSKIRPSASPATAINAAGININGCENCQLMNAAYAGVVRYRAQAITSPMNAPKATGRSNMAVNLKNIKTYTRC